MDEPPRKVTLILCLFLPFHKVHGSLSFGTVWLVIGAMIYFSRGFDGLFVWNDDNNNNTTNNNNDDDYNDDDNANNDDFNDVSDANRDVISYRNNTGWWRRRRPSYSKSTFYYYTGDVYIYVCVIVDDLVTF